jgi:hypothetical protein
MNQQADSELPTKKAIGPWALIAGILLIAFVAYLALLQVANYVTERSTEHYRSMGAAEILTSYMEHKKGKWPTKWEDLAEFMGEREYTGIGNYADLQKYVEIDFDFEPASVDLTKEEYDHPSFDCVRMRSGRKIEGGWNANKMVLEYLVRKSKEH